ncbi:hypothetical protein [Granulosicoccus antarcticus]|uniref:hypothetical protein n=1 Tax=Granulosicoccus antarcticus TaxID=437505 RepID=UPI001F2F2F9B|nr:hypothetical protein [Granulosicoccus antarcticus]
MKDTKPFDISERQVAEAYQRVKANKGGAGVDKQSIEQFDRKLDGNLYKLWNRVATTRRLSRLCRLLRKVEVSEYSECPLSRIEPHKQWSLGCWYLY